MLTLVRMRCFQKLEANDVLLVLDAMRSIGWNPAIRASDIHFLQLAGVDDLRFPLRDLEHVSIGIFGQQRGYGDIFFRDEGVYYFTVSHGKSHDFFYEESKRGFETSRDRQPYLEIGFISNDGDGAYDKVGRFGEELKSALLKSVDGRKTRHMDIAWTPIASEPRFVPNLQQSSQGETEGLRFEPARLDTEELAAAKVLMDLQARMLLREVSQAGFVREQDVLFRKQNKDEIEKSLEIMNTYGLLCAEYVVECKKQKAPLTRLKRADALENEEVGHLECPHCGKRFKDENILRAFSLSPLGERLITKSNWLTLVITDVILKCDIPIESVYWNVLDSSEEVDIVIDFLDQL